MLKISSTSPRSAKLTSRVVATGSMTTRGREHVKSAECLPGPLEILIRSNLRSTQSHVSKWMPLRFATTLQRPIASRGSQSLYHSVRLRSSWNQQHHRSQACHQSQIQPHQKNNFEAGIATWLALALGQSKPHLESKKAHGQRRLKANLRVPFSG